MTYARRRSLHGARGHNLRSRFLGEIPDELIDRQDLASVTGWAGGLGAAGRSRPQPHATPLEFQMGDDVVHATFGEGVVTAVEPGGVIVVRFAADSTERKLMADYAPLKRV
jgi:DNA helicase-2/ATP-dependent DNA helicase PcrA